METIEFETNIKDGIVYIPKKYLQKCKSKKAKIVIYLENEKRKKSLNAISIKTKNFKFDRQEAHER